MREMEVAGSEVNLVMIDVMAQKDGTSSKKELKLIGTVKYCWEGIFERRGELSSMNDIIDKGCV